MITVRQGGGGMLCAECEALGQAGESSTSGNVEGPAADICCRAACAGKRYWRLFD